MPWPYSIVRKCVARKAASINLLATLRVAGRINTRAQKEDERAGQLVASHLLRDERAWHRRFAQGLPQDSPVHGFVAQYASGCFSKITITK